MRFKKIIIAVEVTFLFRTNFISFVPSINEGIYNELVDSTLQINHS